MFSTMSMLPIAGASSRSMPCFVLPVLPLRSRQSTSSLTFASSFASIDHPSPKFVGRQQDQKRGRVVDVFMMAKKKKGPAADALAALEALESEEATAVLIEKPSQPAKRASKKRRGARDPVADASVVPEDAGAEAPLRQDEKSYTDELAGERLLPHLKKAKKRKKGAKGLAAGALAALEGLEREEHNLLEESIAQVRQNGSEVTTVEATATMNQSRQHQEHQKKVDPLVPEHEVAPEEDYEARTIDKSGGEDGQGQSPFEQEHLISAEDMVARGLEAETKVAEEEQEEETLEAKIRKSRPPPRVRVSSTSQPGYVSLRLDGVVVTFRNQEVIKDATWEVKTGDRLGLVGPNGGGKTTQVKILAGEIEPTAGEVVKSTKDLCVAFLRQEFVDELVMERSLKQELRSVFTEEAAILTAISACEDELQLESVQQGPDLMEDVLNRLAKWQDDAERLHVYDIETKVQRIMDLMGFMPSEGDQMVSSFSGGWRMRIGLGKILLNEPNVLLLDEPTNHLDMDSVEWLEEFLQNQKLPMVIVSHDREFLDRVCTGIVDTEGGVAMTYPGNYSRFLKLKQARMEAWNASYRNQQKRIKEERSWINKFKAKGAWAAQVKSRTAALDRLLKSDEYVKPPPFMGKPFRFRFPPAPRIGTSEETVLVERLGHGYNCRTLFRGINLDINKGERVAFLGPNGAGKSTLLRLIVGEEEPNEGRCTVGSSVVKQYFEQNQADVLDLSKTVMETIMGASTTQKYEDLRKLLGQFLFKGDAVEKKIEQLSGGEKARVALCKMMLTPANLLVLDEPTNHLDIPAKEMLEEALQHYEGAVLLVSHDRYFVSQVATTICNLEEGKLVRYDGDYRYFLERNDNILEKVESRYVSGVSGIQKAKVVDLEEVNKQKQKFGGKGGPSGRKDKGVKNAKRHAERV